MQMSDLLDSLRERDIRLSLKNGELAYHAPKGVLSADDLATLRLHKVPLLELLNQRAEDASVIPRLERTAGAPLATSFAQQRLWFLDRMGRGRAYHIHTAIRLRGALDVALLKRVLDTIVERHEVLRTVFGEAEGQVVQWVRERQEFPLREIDLSRHDGTVRDTLLGLRCTEEVEEKFDLAVGPPLRGLLLRESAASHVLLVTLHHIVADGWSLGLLMREFSTLYQAYRNGQQNPLPPLTRQYADFSSWQRRQLQGRTLRDLQAYWHSQLQGASYPRFPADLTYPKTRTYKGALHHFTIDERHAAQLADLARETQATMYMTLLAAFQVLIWRFSGQLDVVVASPVAGRGAPETEAMMGCFVNMMLMRTRIQERMSFRQLVMDVRDMALSAFEHRELPFEQLVAELQAEHGGAADALSRVVFALEHGGADGRAALADLTLEPFGVDLDGTAKTDLMLTLFQGEQGLFGTFSYTSDLLDAATVQQLVERFALLIEQVVSGPDRAVGDIDLTLPVSGTQRPRTMPLSMHQQMMWLDLQLHPERGSYYIVGDCMDIATAVDRVLFDKAVATVVQATAALRLRFTFDSDGLLRQEILPNRAFQVVHLDYSQEPDAEAKAVATVEHWRTHPIDLLTEPYRYFLLKVSERRWFWFVNFHHLLMDGIGCTLLRYRVSKIYSALVRGEAAELPADDEQYREYLRLEAEYPYSPRYVTDAGFWRGHLDRASAATLCVRAGSSADLTAHRAGYRLQVAESTAVRKRAADLGMSVGRLMILTLVLYVQKITGRSSVCVGLPTHGRFDECARELVGACTNIAPARFDVEPGEPLATFARRTAATLKQALRHNRFAYEDIRRLFALRSADEALFNISINVLPFTSEADYFESTRVLVYTHPRYERDLIIWVFYATDSEELWVVVDGNPALYEPWELEQHVERITAFAATLAAVDPAAPVETLPLLAARERQRCSEELSGAQVVSPVAELVHERFAQRARRCPQSTAVVHAGARIDYGQLNERANRLAHYLRSHDVGAGSLVAICVERSIEMVVAVLGTLKAGAGYVPFDPRYPVERLQQMLTQSAPDAVLSESKFMELLAGDGVDALALDKEWHRVAQHPSHDPEWRDALWSRQLAYIIFTSGSTGKPKGAGVEHRGVANLADWYEREYGFTQDDRVLLVSSFSFDLTQKNFFATLASGAQLHLAEEPFDPRGIAQYIRANAITVLNLSPSAFYAIADEQSGLLPLLSSLRCVILGGEPINIARIAALQAVCPALRLVNSYGPTECADVSAAHTLPPDWALHPQSDVPIGRPVVNTRTYVMTPQLEPAPIGVAGEIHIAGIGVGRGYLGNAGLTADRFIADPFVAAERMYRTGDLGRWRADGTLEFLGRTDHQVKMRGYRIELGEIEACLTQYPGVERAAVLMREDVPGVQRLVAYVTAHAAGELPIAALQAHLEQRLPQYMVPRSVVTLAQWPLTPSGKLDRSALPVPAAGTLSRGPYLEPEGEIERMLATLWQQLLQVERIGRHDNFFELGGHSLLAVMVVTRLRAAGHEVPLSAIFAKRTLSGLSEFIAARGSVAGGDASLVTLQPSGAATPLFAVHDITGEVVHLHSLAECMRFPVYGLSLSSFEEFMTLQDIAAHHVRAIRRKQPQGPYRLLGHSFGGLIAYEIAHQLRAAGDRVEFLGMLDSYRPTPAAAAVEVSESTALVVCLRERFASLNLAEMQELTELPTVEDVVARGKELGLLPQALPLEEVRIWARNSARAVNAGRRYQPPPTDLHLHLFTAQDGAGADATLGWSALAHGGIEVCSLDGNHMSILRAPHAARIAEEVMLQLDAHSASPN